MRAKLRMIKQEMWRRMHHQPLLGRPYRDRRDLITLLGGVAAAWPLSARAQQAAKMYRIGYLGVTSHAEYAREVEALLKGLRQLGYEEGKNIAIHYQFAEGDYDRLPALAAELVTLKVDVLLTIVRPGPARPGKPPRLFQLS
jgi:putative ABC transport system substrate-binding protein